ncbi:MAG: sortase [Bacilli bacterium]|nr:sortase [Bacilli bacterium]
MFLKLIKFLSFVFLFFSFSLCNYNENRLNNKVDEYISHNYLNEKVSAEPSKPITLRSNQSIYIPKINLEKNLYSINSKLNTVNKNIQILKNSDMPDKENGNFVLAAHSGNSSVSYFHNLYKLDIGDEVIIKYNNHKYIYAVDKKYEVIKTGKVSIKRDKNKNSITLITCKEKDKQLVVIGYLT